MDGYLHPNYIDSFSEFGTTVYLKNSGGWLLKRMIPGSSDYDAMGAYPLFCCKDWLGLPADIENLEEELVSISLVADPFGGFDYEDLKKSFDICIPFKNHYVLDLTQPIEKSISSGRRKDSRRSLRNLTVDLCTTPASYLGEWVSLYSVLISKHNIHGIRSFSRNSFAKQLSIPGIYYFRALHDGRVVGGSLYYLQNDIVYYHLSAVNDEGYALDASYAIMWSAIQFFLPIANWLNLGGGAGTKNVGTDGLTLFKQGWSTGTKTAYFCGRILNPQKYAEIAKSKGISETNFFPAYRSNDF